jgi:hypothetical protein
MPTRIMVLTNDDVDSNLPDRTPGLVVTLTIAPYQPNLRWRIEKKKKGNKKTSAGSWKFQEQAQKKKQVYLNFAYFT